MRQNIQTEPSNYASPRISKSDVGTLSQLRYFRAEKLQNNKFQNDIT